jgi:class 3 adenylate cyclase
VLTARIGLETGPAVLDAAGEIYGDVANIAARVQRQVAGLFVAEERGTMGGEPAASGVTGRTFV